MFEGLLQPIHLVIILVIIMIVFGAGKLPEVGGGLGRSITEFRKGVREATEDEPTEAAPSVPELARPIQASANTCGACGAPLAGGAKFCTSCGARQAA